MPDFHAMTVISIALSNENSGIGCLWYVCVWRGTCLLFQAWILVLRIQSRCIIKRWTLHVIGTLNFSSPTGLTIVPLIIWLTMDSTTSWTGLMREHGTPLEESLEELWVNLHNFEKGADTEQCVLCLFSSSPVWTCIYNVHVRYM